MIIKGFLFIGRTKSVLPDEKKKKEYFRGLVDKFHDEPRVNIL